MIRVLDSAGSTLVEWGRQQQQLGSLQQSVSVVYMVNIGTCLCNIVLMSYNAFAERNVTNLHLYKWQLRSCFLKLSYTLRGLCIDVEPSV